MGNKLYSIWLKTLAFLLCITSVSAAVFAVYRAIGRYEGVYRFEKDFESSSYVKNKLEGVGNKLYSEFVHDAVNVNDFDNYAYIIKDSEGKTVLKSTSSADEYPVILNFPQKTVYVGFAKKAWDELYTLWYADYRLVQQTLWICVAALLLALCCFVYLLVVCGRKERGGEVKLLLIDYLPPEVTAALIVGVIFLGLGAAATLAYMAYDIYGLLVPTLAGITAFCGAAIIISLLQSLVRAAKAGVLIPRSFIMRLYNVVLRTGKRLWREIASFEKNAAAWKVYAIFISYSAVLIISALMDSVLFTVVILVGAYVYVKKHVEAFMLVKNGVSEIKNGDLGYRIENVPEGIFSQLAQDINSIGEGMEASLSDKLKAERMKSELITNVSHDLKTPLTSIISYTKLLSDMELEPCEANDYVQIISKKSERLKNLTADLFDYSKVQSGNGDIVLEKIDLSLLVRQAMAEAEEAIKKSRLQFVTDMPESAFALGDGKKLSRVLENLIGNSLKYSLEGTRVYITVRGREIEIKNIANYEMTFDENEITERFVRGDEARTSEGSGLGLAIAKSYVEAMDGEFYVKRDGDLFKAFIRLKQ